MLGIYFFVEHYINILCGFPEFCFREVLLCTERKYVRKDIHTYTSIFLSEYSSLSDVMIDWYILNVFKSRMRGNVHFSLWARSSVNL
jgi:hypothetical protein